MAKHIVTLPDGFKLYEYLNYQSDINFIDEINELLKPNYIDTTTLIERETKHNNIIYFTRDINNILSSFFMTNFDKFGSTIIVCRQNKLNYLLESVS